MYALINLKWSIFQQQDNMSDSSGEITTSDSGRGGSDLDLSLHLSKSGKLLHLVQGVFWKCLNVSMCNRQKMSTHYERGINIVYAWL